MNAVNLIPADARKRGSNVSASPLTIGLIGGLVVILAAAVLYVSAMNDVRSRTSQLTKVTASVSSWQAAANSYASIEKTAQQRSAQLASIRGLAGGRFPWSQLLSQIGGVMPAKAALSSLQTTAPQASATAPATGAAAPTTATTVAGSVMALAGCAQDQSTVAETMEQLRRVSGVSDVSLTSSSDGTSGATAAAPAAGSASSSPGACPFPVQFEMSLTLAASTIGSTGAGTTSAAAIPAASTTTTPRAAGAAQ